ncbi:uncharacterized protein LOC110116539 isoform X2 [Dendrobium catenatum]|uniref:Large ribosomal subunit protein uL1c n=1 Tax=Dendrobium catenatum TaxID=906689 RepID=A0A2I0WAH3_9ASPA|nr:uncharacterized protein LOC110116539 isoform X2 [Dendrobium catenatum]PKU72654.1 50S ribosomal protein L1, chloroplastic [Dendrobium catenatum]
MLLSQARRCYLRRPPTLFSHQLLSPSLPPETPFSKSSSFPVFYRSSSSIPITPVAYPPKPKESDETVENQTSSAARMRPSRRELEPSERADSTPPEAGAASPDFDPRAWTRRDVRFVKDVPKITPVSYPSRVAPLPEDRTAAPEAAEEEFPRGDLQSEARKIRSDARVRSYFGLTQEEIIPFPTLIKLDKRPTKVPMELTVAIREVKANAKRNFLETVEAHVNLGVDPRRSDQMVRGALTLPHGTGKTVRVAVFAEGAAADEARAAGADIVGGDELIEEIKAGGGKIKFDKCIATPMFMPRLSKIGRILGPRGLMPNPKLGSVTNDVSGAVKAAKCGRIDFKIDKTAIVHVGLGKVNFTEDNLRENIGAFVNALLVAKPVGLKKTSKYAGYVKNFTLSSTMGPGFPVTIQSLSAAADTYTKVQAK